jgi:hypothetical protein
MGVDNEPLVMGGHMVAANKRSAVKTHVPVEVVEDEVSGEIEPRTPPERIRNPGIQVIVGIRRRIVSYHRGAVIIIVIVDHLGPRTRDGIFGRGLHLLTGRFTGRRGTNRFPDHFNPVPVFFGDGVVLVGEMDHPVSVDVFIDDRAGRSGSSGRRSLRAGFGVDVQSQFGFEFPYRPQGFSLAHL